MKIKTLLAISVFGFVAMPAFATNDADDNSRFVVKETRCEARAAQQADREDNSNTLCGYFAFHAD